MTPVTRSRGENPPESVSYKSTAAAPKQKKFTARRKQVKGYGKPRSTRGSSRQETLTQMNFVSSSNPKDLLVPEDEDDEEPAEDAEPSPPAPAVKSNKRGRASRRRTAGDELVEDEKPRSTKRRRKTDGDVPGSTPSGSFHTQTLTQLLSTKGDQDEDWRNDILADDDDNDAGLIMETPKKPKTGAPSVAGGSRSEQQPEVRSSVPSLIKSVTPTNRRTRVIQSSTSPETPPSPRYFPLPNDSPLKTRAANVTAQASILKSTRNIPKDRVIPDSYSTVNSSQPAPAQSSDKVTPVKKARFALPEDKENITPGRTKPKTPKPLRKTPGRPALREVPDQEPPEQELSDREVPDTDDDDFDNNENIDDEETVDGDEDENAPMGAMEEDIDDPQLAETCYGDIGDETQAGLEELSRELSDSEETIRSRSSTPTPNPKQKQRQAFSTTHTTKASNSVSTPAKEKDPSDENVSKEHTQFYTQALESQRLSIEAIRALGPQTPNSDIMVSLHPEPLENILNGTKNHEFRSWKIPSSVNRVWLYSTKPHSELKYMCQLSEAKVPGEIEDEEGVGNAEFNLGHGSKFAYEILQVYELNDPVSLEEMKDKGWLAAPPQKYRWVPPAVVGELTANLKYALFGEETQETDAEAALVATSPNVTESQEVHAQLRKDVEYSTQHHSSATVDEVIPLSQSPLRSAGKAKGKQSRSSGSFAKPAIPRSLSGSSVQAQPAPSNQTPRGVVRPSQATTVSSPTPTVSPEKSLPRAAATSSQPAAISIHSSSPTAFRSARNHSLRSSQFLTRSQMLPDSLLNDEIQEPPPIIWDSADDQSD
ncbi:hypothetical protein GGS26DRAFT_579271 [Hypomontagnella submonticulosa]|nr:hypothetical protein GGS26DRAFT_579271 [Hypomontagnella submonticulosa]